MLWVDPFDDRGNISRGGFWWVSEPDVVHKLCKVTQKACVMMATELRRLKTLWLLFFIISSNQVMSAELSLTNAYVKFARAFTVNKPKDRRALVIAAIDDGLIQRGISLSDVKLMFGDSLDFGTRDKNSHKLTARASFEPKIEAPRSMAGVAEEGWYISFVFLSDDHLEFYSLSNLHKWRIRTERGQTRMALKLGRCLSAVVLPVAIAVLTISEKVTGFG
jgi:hypothetical protein